MWILKSVSVQMSYVFLSQWEVPNVYGNVILGIKDSLTRDLVYILMAKGLHCCAIKVSKSSKGTGEWVWAIEFQQHWKYGKPFLRERIVKMGCEGDVVTSAVCRVMV